MMNEQAVQRQQVVDNDLKFEYVAHVNKAGIGIRCSKHGAQTCSNSARLRPASG
jgi:hypothetical protein